MHGSERVAVNTDTELDMKEHHMHMMHDMEKKIEQRPLPPYRHLRSIKPTTFSQSNLWRTITLTLDGDMERFVCTINGKILSEIKPIIIKLGENVRIIFENKSMMHHPMHLHGHFFRVLNVQGEYAPLKHTVDMPPIRRQIIEF